MGIVSLIWGILSLLWMLLALIPLLGWGNWFMIPFAAVGVILAIVAIAADKGRVWGIIGLLLCIIAIGIGTLRLMLGGGIL
ncbi:hypothetical protein [Thermomonas sp.]|jgi:hypothetical protein|uniref:hypothetical protein n=1 Tax=Thermomonas sp. TaxID=1971895 RepID=UPI00257A2F47|nr:hypothetical protein [Thermomonas sp.]